MHWLSRGAEALVRRIDENLKDSTKQEDFDAVIVGSGYGGAVAACRLAAAGYSVCVLERGEEYVPGEFPNDLSNLPSHVRLERKDRPGITGRREGLFDVRLHGHVSTLVGNALGGTSQINANVALRADPELFRARCWPKALREQYDALDPYYTVAEQVLGVGPYPHDSAKAEQLRRLAEPLNAHLRAQAAAGETPAQARFYRPPLAITYGDKQPSAAGVKQKACKGCGDCVTGCNVGAKNTLTMNYLPLARRHGAEIYTGATVLAVEPRAPAGGSTCAMVHFAYTDRDLSGLLDLTREQWNQVKGGYFTVRAKFVVLAAGALGSTEIMLRSRVLRMLDASPRLGSGFSGNGDGTHIGFDQDQKVDGVGWGAENRAGPGPGPTIVGVLDVRDGLPLRQGMLIEEGILPGAIARATHELIATASTLAQLERSAFKHEAAGCDPLALSQEALEHTQVYLAMGHDEASGSLRLHHGRAFVDWPEALQQPALAQQETYLDLTREAFDALYMPHPTLNPVPASLSEMLSGPPIQGSAIVVHPLGGCAMGESFESAVVDDIGAVYDGKTPHSTYESLYVLDGAIAPCSLGVNPFLTITALAERAVHLLIERRRKDEYPKPEPTEAEAPIPMRRVRPPQPVDGRVDVYLKETMRGRLHWHGDAHPSVKDGMVDAAMYLETTVQDFGQFVRSAEHLVTGVRGHFDLPPLGVIPVRSGQIEFLPPEPLHWYSRFSRTLRGLIHWFRKRGRDEIVRLFRGPSKGFEFLKLIRYARSILRIAYHAGERRELRYELELDAPTGPLRLSGKKIVRYEKGVNLWRSLLTLPLEIKREGSGHRLASGSLRVDLIDLAEGDLPQLRRAPDLPNALLALAGLPLFMLRVILKIHFWDLRAPDYRSRNLRAPLSGQRPLLADTVALSGKSVAAERHWFEVPVKPDPANGPRLPLVLTRFQPPPGLPKAAVNANRMPVLLLHGYAQSSRAFVCDRLPEDLVRHLLRMNFDVWLLDYRTSTALPSGREQCLLDDVAACDIPAAVGYIREQTSKPTICAFGHCMGAATLAMSLLSGQLREGGKSLISRAVFSQVPPFIVGGYYSQFRRQLAAFFRDAVGVHNINLAADDAATGWEVLMDRVFATLPVEIAPKPYHEGTSDPCPYEHDLSEPRPDIATCKRVSGIIGPLYLHDNVKSAHPLMHEYFGWGSISVLAQIAKFFEYERLVSADGGNAYVTDDNILHNLDMPVALLHGDRNQVFDPESARRTKQRIDRIHPRNCTLLKIPKDQHYAHFDCLIGDKAHEHLFPQVSDFLAQAEGTDAAIKAPSEVTEEAAA